MAELMLVNPKKRTRRKSRRRMGFSRVKRRSPSRSIATRKVRRYRRNPIKKSMIMDTVKTGAIGAAGALATDVAFAKLPLPANLKSGTMGAVTKGLVGVGLGMAVAKFGKQRALGRDLANGAVTVALYNAGKSAIGPSLGLSGMDDGLLGYDESLLGYFDDEDMVDDGMGYYSPAEVFDADEF